MKVTYNWLKDFVDITLTPEKLADTLTMAGLEVTSWEKKGNDYVLEIEITSNRPDWLSIIGVAREVAAITGKKLNLSKATGRKSPAARINPAAGDIRAVAVSIEDTKDCPLYTARVITAVNVGPSPVWLKERLELVGCRSINNIVDITNYVLFTTGEPLHAFDLDVLRSRADRIVVRRARKGETLATIDGINRQLDTNILVIAAGDTPVAVAGVMGGKDTEVSGQTHHVLLEAAAFDPVVIRRSRQRLGLQSESAYRFERGVDLAGVENASSLAAALMHELAGGSYVAAKKCGSGSRGSKNIPLRIETAEAILGIKLTAGRIQQILSGLGFMVKPKGKHELQVQAPSYRADVSQEIDLIEELARIIGYENVPESLPSLAAGSRLPAVRSTIDDIKNVLVGLGLYEVITYSLVERQDDVSIAIENPLSAEQGFLRTSLIPSLTSVVAGNINQKQEYIGIFEIAKIFAGSAGPHSERWALSVALCGEKHIWLAQGRVKDEAGLLHIKGILCALCEKMGIPGISFSVQQNTGRVQILINGRVIGSCSKLDRMALDKAQIKNKDVYAAEIDLETLISYMQAEKKFHPLPLYPAITRDISFMVGQGVTVSTIIDAIKQKNIALLRDVMITDTYSGKQIPAGSTGLTISCFYRSDERTLTEEEITPLQSQVQAVLKETFGATLR